MLITIPVSGYYEERYPVEGPKIVDEDRPQASDSSIWRADDRENPERPKRRMEIPRRLRGADPRPELRVTCYRIMVVPVDSLRRLRDVYGLLATRRRAGGRRVR